MIALNIGAIMQFFWDVLLMNLCYFQAVLPVVEAKALNALEITLE